MRTTICVAAVLLTLAGAGANRSAAGASPRATARSLPGRWVSAEQTSDPVTLDFFRRTKTVEQLTAATSRALAGRPVLLAGSLRDSRVSPDPRTRRPFAVAQDDDALVLLICAEAEDTPPAKWRLRIAPGEARRDDRLFVAEGGEGKAWTEYRRAPESIRSHAVSLAGPSAGVELRHRYDCASDFHTGLDSRLRWDAQDADRTREMVWEGVSAVAGAVSPDAEKVAVVLAEGGGWDEDTELVVVDLATGRATHTGQAPAGVAAMGSSIRPRPSLTWGDAKTVVFTTGRGEMFERRIVLLAYDTESRRAAPFADAETGETALLEPGFRHEFARSEDGGLFFRVDLRDDALYPLDVEKRTVGRPITVPEEKRPKNWRMLTRQWLERMGRQ